MLNKVGIESAASFFQQQQYPLWQEVPVGLQGSQMESAQMLDLMGQRALCGTRAEHCSFLTEHLETTVFVA